MTLLHNETSTDIAPAGAAPADRMNTPGLPRLHGGQVLNGQYVGVLRSEKGKVKGLRLRSSQTEYAIKLPKYLRPMLARELVVNAFIQVWAYPDNGIWRAINVLPLSDAETSALLPQQEIPLQAQSPSSAQTRIQICGKGKCYRQGSHAIWRSLQAELDANPTLQPISLEMTGCMKACKFGPNLRIYPKGGGASEVCNRVDARLALALLASLPEPTVVRGEGNRAMDITSSA